MPASSVSFPPIHFRPSLAHCSTTCASHPVPLHKSSQSAGTAISSLPPLRLIPTTHLRLDIRHDLRRLLHRLNNRYALQPRPERERRSLLVGADEGELEEVVEDGLGDGAVGRGEEEDEA